MDNIRNTTARLRRTFAYPTDGDSPDSPDVLDEEEQETLIANLTDQNAERNLQYRQLLLFLPALAAVPFLLVLFRPPTFFLSVLSLSSLASSGWLVWRLPPYETGIRLLDAWARGELFSGVDPGEQGAAWGSSSSAVRVGTGIGPSGILGGSGSGRRRRRTSSFSLGGQHRSPLETWLPFLNLGLGALVLVMGFLGGKGREEVTDGWLGRVGLGNLPLAVYLVVLAAKVVMASVDPERELASLRYVYKGA